MFRNKLLETSDGTNGIEPCCSSCSIPFVPICRAPKTALWRMWCEWLSLIFEFWWTCLLSLLWMWWMALVVHTHCICSFLIICIKLFYSRSKVNQEPMVTLPSFHLFVTDPFVTDPSVLEQLGVGHVYGEDDGTWPLGIYEVSEIFHATTFWKIWAPHH